LRLRLPAWRLPAWRWTVSHQILLLVAVSILAAQAAGLVVLLTLPPRPPAPVAMDQAIERIRVAVRLVRATSGADAAQEARAASDRRMVFTVVQTPPPALEDPFAQRFSALFAERLGLAPASVRMVEASPRPRRGPRPGQGPRPGPSDGPGDGPDGPGGPGGGPGPDGGPLTPEGVSQTLDRAIDQERPPGFFGDRRFSGPGGGPGGGRGFRQGPRSRDFPVFPRGRRGLAVQAGVQWLVIRSPPSSSDALWLRQVGLTFALTLAALLLPALWLANRTARRIRAFAEGADRFGRNPDIPQMPEQGPYELRQAAAAFNRMQARIQRLVSDRTMMMAAVSHDLRTPLARVRFRIAELDPAVRDSIAEDIQQMDELISQMLSFTRDALPGAERRRFDLSALAQSLVDDLADEGKDVTFAGPDKLTVEANLAAVRRVLSNLLDNAVKFAGHARVTLAPDGDMALLIVEDAGPGVPADMREAIFEPFRRVEPSRNRETGGVGLGLAIARNLARGHGGDIVLEPAARGARFVFSLPRA
jgi:two-component system OmpR family sensor kinase